MKTFLKRCANHSYRFLTVRPVKIPFEKTSMTLKNINITIKGCYQEPPILLYHNSNPFPQFNFMRRDICRKTHISYVLMYQWLRFQPYTP